jgi:hypothetical protein
MRNNNETKNYHCGCGKSYISYPAYSTHKRLKHGNEAIAGTQLPNQYLPKRGRPSFVLPNQQPSQDKSFAGLTTIELALITLEEKYGSVLS